MATLNVFAGYELTADGVQLRGGSCSAPVEIEVDGAWNELKKLLGSGTTWDVWESGAEEPLSDFDFLWIESDADYRVEVTCDNGNEVGREEFAFIVEGGRPFMLCGDAAMANYTADFATGTVDVIDRIRIRNTSAATASFRVLFVT